MPAKKISALTETESLNDDLELPLYDPEGATPALKNRRARLATVIAWLIDGFSYLLNVAEDTSPQLGGPLDTNDHQIRESKGADVASASTLTLPADGNYYDITGTTAITAIATLGVGTMVTLHFDGILTLTHHATDLILPGGANITTAAGDEAIFREYAGGDWRCIAYTRATGLPVAASSGGIESVVADTSPQLGGPLDTNDHQIRESKGADVASASTLTLPADGNYYDITGTTAITAIATLGVGTMVTLHFDGILTLTHHATDLILPGGANITTAAGDEAIFREYAVGDWRCIAYTRASGLPLAESPAAGGIPTEVVYVDSTTLNLNQSHVGKMFAIYGDSSDAGVQIRTQAQSESDGHAWQAGAYFWAFGEGGSNTERILEPSSNTLYNNGALGNITLTGGKVHLVYRQMSGTWRVIAAS